MQLDNVKNYIESLPLEDDPEVFGLNYNANITLQQKNIKSFMDTLLNVSPRTVASKDSTEDTPDEIAKKLAMQIKKKLQNAIKYVKSAKPDSLEIFRN